MATIAYSLDAGSVGSGVYKLFWETLTENDTAQEYQPQKTAAAIGSMYVTGTFGGATVALQGSNDGTNYVALKDTTGTAIGLTAAGAVEFDTAMRYIRPSASGGSSQDLDITIVLRG